jgi:hypothetical protein
MLIKVKSCNKGNKGNRFLISALGEVGGTRCTLCWVAPGLVWRGAGSLSSTGIRSLDRPAPIVLQYRLNYSFVLGTEIVITTKLTFMPARTTFLASSINYFSFTCFIRQGAPRICVYAILWNSNDEIWHLNSLTLWTILWRILKLSLPLRVGDWVDPRLKSFVFYKANVTT